MLEVTCINIDTLVDGSIFIRLLMLHLATQSHIQSNTPLSQLLWCSNLIFLIRAFNIHINKLKC